MLKVKRSTYPYHDVIFKNSINKKDCEEYISCPKIKSLHDVFSILHELGHCKEFRNIKSKRHLIRWVESSLIAENELIYDSISLNSEIEAWLYVFDCVKSEVYNILINDCILSFLSYLEDSNRKRRKYWTNKFKNKIINKITKNYKKQSKNIINIILKDNNI